MARSHREKEIRDERERSRLEAANKRKGRAERRRMDGEPCKNHWLCCLLIKLADSDPSDEIPLAARSTAGKSLEAAAQVQDPPQSSHAATPDSPPGRPPSISYKKGGRPHNFRKGKLGRNQYTKDKDPLELDDHSPNRSQSRDVQRGDDHGQTTVNRSSINEGKQGRSRAGNSKITMSDMKKRVAAILDFISRTQLEMAGESMSPRSGDATEKMVRTLAEGLPMIQVNGDDGRELRESEGGPLPPRKEFKDLSCLEMMDVLTKDLIKWQNQFS